MNNKQVKTLCKRIEMAVQNVEITDIHTHLYSPSFGKLLLWGVDELVTYHYLVAEAFRWLNIPYRRFWAMSKQDQADLVWRKLFIENTPYSESCRGVLTVLNKLGLNVAKRDLNAYRKYFKKMKTEEYLDRVLKIAGIKDVVMTNDPFDSAERPIWERNYKMDGRFHAALRLDALLNNWKESYKMLRSWNYNVSADLTPGTKKEIRRFLKDWIDRMKALYMAVSLPPTFQFPEKSARSVIIKECILPVSRDRNVPFAMMIGVKKLTNPGLALAGDSVGKGSIEVIEYLCSTYPDNKFLVTMLSRENQHELCVAARKFRNLMIFGCWWFLNNPSIIEMMTRQRFELLGASIIPQHSDARVLDQLIYKWDHSRRIIADVLFDKYCDIGEAGWIATRAEIERDVAKLFKGNFWSFLKR